MNENVITITGTLGKTPELRYTAGGRGVATFSVATNRRWMNKTTQEWQEETCWHNVTAWAELGENCAASLEKGNRVMVVGRLSTRSYEDREGTKKYITEIIADNVGAELRFATCSIEKTERSGPSGPTDASRSAKPARPADPVYGDEAPF
jgi:single-strand DNA-binding protein